ncbi:hypothetical protein GY45DRAFT_1121940 [Cubamyces sp. BRFM 1775]|nr:hypothetical protein GY45DRAFT_1121940 [Cubamyces sp. BRFM 1775]
MNINALQEGRSPTTLLSMLGMQPRLPVETIEHAIGFLNGDFPSLVACSLACRTLLPACRAQLWRDISTIDGKDRQDVWLAGLSEVLTSNPELRSYARSFTLSCSATSRIPVEYAVDFCKFFPSLRSLTICDLPQWHILRLLSLINSIPTLEELHLHNVARNTVEVPPDLLLASPFLPSLEHLRISSTYSAGSQSRRPHLTTLSVVCQGSLAMASDLEQLVPFLERSRHSSSFRSLDLRAGNKSSGFAPQVQVPSFAPQLTHFGIEILCSFGRDGTTVVPGSRENMLRVLSDLQRCGATRSLSLLFDCPLAFWLREFYRDVLGSEAQLPLGASPTFIIAFSDELDTPGPPALPELG